MRTTDDGFRCVHCGTDLEEHSHSSGYAVFWCPGKVMQQIYLAPWQAAAGHCVRCGHERAHHFRDGRCRWFQDQQFLAATPGLTAQTARDRHAWDEGAETMRQAMTQP